MMLTERKKLACIAPWSMDGFDDFIGAGFALTECAAATPTVSFADVKRSGGPAPDRSWFALNLSA